jgi:hypothetical protein
MSKRASQDLMDKLHAVLAEDMLERVTKGEEVVVGKGEDQRIERVKCSAATLNVVRQFLKDNHIEGIPVQGSVLGKLVDSLPDYDEDEATNVVRLGR